MRVTHAQLEEGGIPLAYVGQTALEPFAGEGGRKRMLDVFPGRDVKGRPPVLPYAYRPLEQIFLDKGSASVWQYAFQSVGVDMAQVFIYFTKVEKGSGTMELQIVQKLSSILQGSITAPLNSDSAWLYFVYTTTAVAVQMRRVMAPT